MNRTCVKLQIAYRKVQRHPVIKKTHRIRKYVSKGAAFGILPTGINDMVFHHANVSVEEMVQIVTDQVSISSMTLALAFLFFRRKQ